MVLTVWTFTIPDWTPPLNNQWVGRHWSVKHKLRDQATEFLWGYAMKAGIPRVTGKRRVEVHLTGWPSGRQPDCDAFDKLLQDALVQAGLLVDDSPKWLDGRMVVTVERSKVRSTRVTLVDV